MKLSSPPALSSTFMSFKVRVSRSAVRAALATLRLYQQTLSPDHGLLKTLFPTGCCRYTPTCSTYTAQAVSQFGVGRGIFMGVRRVLHCHPGAQGGYDPLPSA